MGKASMKEVKKRTSNLKRRKSFEKLDDHKSLAEHLKMLTLLDKDELVEKYSWTRVLTWNYIETGYRRPSGSGVECINSLFYLHNELINSWTHIAGSIYLVFLLSQV